MCVLLPLGRRDPVGRPADLDLALLSICYNMYCYLLYIHIGRCIYIYIYICIHKQICIYIYIYIYIHMYYMLYILLPEERELRACGVLHVLDHRILATCMYICIYTHTHIYICIHMYTYIHIYIYVYIMFISVIVIIITNIINHSIITTINIIFIIIIIIIIIIGSSPLGPVWIT